MWIGIGWCIGMIAKETGNQSSDTRTHVGGWDTVMLSHVDISYDGIYMANVPYVRGGSPYMYVKWSTEFGPCCC